MSVRAYQSAKLFLNEGFSAIKREVLESKLREINMIAITPVTE